MSAFTTLSGSRISCCRRKAACSTAFPSAASTPSAWCWLFWIAAHRVRLAGARRRRRRRSPRWRLRSAAVPGDAGLHARYFATDAGRRRARTQHRVSRPGVHARRSTTRFRAAASAISPWRSSTTTRDSISRSPASPIAATWSLPSPGTDGGGSAPGTHTLFVHAPEATAEIAIDASPVAARCAGVGRANDRHHPDAADGIGCT